MPVLESEIMRLKQEIQWARSESDRFFNLLKPDALLERPIDERHRVLFYIGHLDGFDSIHICKEGLGIPSPDPELDTVFQAGIDPDPGQLPFDQPSDWPSLDRISQYVTGARRHVDKHLERAPEEIVSMVLEHRIMHLETLAYMLHNFDYSRKRPAPDERPTSEGTFVENEWREIPAGKAILGRRRDDSFGWDNEYEENRLQIPEFRIQRYNVTNGEYLRFVSEGAAIPHFWRRTPKGIVYRGMFTEFPLPLDWPVYVTQQQAAAYAKWIAKDLMTEAQFHRAAYGTPDGAQRKYPWGEAAPSRRHGNFDFARWEPEPVTANPAGDSAFDVRQLLGNGWEWTGTPFRPFPGFQPRPTYPGYSANFFDDDHFVIKGGSPRTSAVLLRRSFRNWFRYDYPYLYATFRCVEN
ncbi:MAG TPA: SUMF1/EgtB/PvdO family nonheme iron enzyme [Bryobacteraceae bacterium]|jgi:formylglycine-generating enzyme required for sulfatase activity|nr:SUMF1/EgtB/PvdO family nonheme iron enzyme [Bryobacteraceae bacterium]